MNEFLDEIFILSVALVFLLAGYFMGKGKKHTSGGGFTFKSQGSTDEPEGDLFNDQLRDVETGERMETIR